MAPFIADYAKGRFVEKYRLPIGGDNILMVLLQSSGLQADSTLNSYQYLGDVLAGGNLEATFTNYARKVLAAADITITVNTSTNITTVDTSDQTWSSAGGATNNTLGALLTCYRQTSSTPDSAVLVLTKHDFATATNGVDMKAVVPSVATAQ